MQLYDVVRTVHLERVQALGAETHKVTILYRERRYDFDSELAKTLALQRAGAWRSFWYAARHDIDVLEVAEPYVVQSALRSLLVIAAARARSRVRRRPPPRVVSYAIENLSPYESAPRLPLKARLKRRALIVFVPTLWKRLDRVAFGTGEAARLYGAQFGGHEPPVTRLFESIPTAENPGVKDPAPVLVFLGDMSIRKGFPDVLSAWARVAAEAPTARLMLVGRGAGVADARLLAASDDRVGVLVDPPRDAIFETLRSAKVLVLPSRRMPLWKEQVGLPILEGLARGCLIVTTTETGIAGWLSAHGHWVVPEAAVSEALPHALVEALTSARSPESVIADLPPTEGRAAAQEWMYREE
ncbi:glycosyltransferase family 4 protein [Miniimonas sp. S16]|uniref:glycosyltransferase family 4 protein n=1 Tax=Miniimonas sp. S16 TaxID=2171623 RepID=UPI00131F3C8A|nr:glycosyltransferase family 4 protein [Miniimonas sp. S16]